jgi:hypothetical protein
MSFQCALLGLGFALASAKPAEAQRVVFAAAAAAVDFGEVNLCARGQTAPPPCSEIVTLAYNVTAGGTLGPIKVATLGAPNLDFTLAEGSNCAGAVKAGTTCIVKVNFAPRFAGTRPGGVQITGAGGEVLATTLISGFGAGPQIGFSPATQTTLATVGDGQPDQIYEMALDGAGDLFLDAASGLIELPAGGGPPIEIRATSGAATTGVAIDGAGNLFLDDPGNSRLLELLAGGGAEIALPASGLSDARGLAADVAGDIFVADPAHSRVVEFPADGAPEIEAGNDTYGNGIYNPYGVAVDGQGDVFVANAELVRFLGERMFVTAGEVVELPAKGGAQIPLPFLTSGIFSPQQLVLDGPGDLFVADPNDNQVLELPVGGGAQIALPYAGLAFPAAIAVDGAGDIFLADQNSTVAELRRSQPPALNFGTVAVGATATLPLAITNLGTGTLTIAASLATSDYSVAGASPSGCLAGIAPGQVCTLQVAFAPSAIGLDEAILTLAANGVGNNRVISLQGAARGPAAPVLSLASGVYASPQSVTIADSTPGAKIFYTAEGTVPTAASTAYNGPIAVASTERLTAVAFLGTTASPLATAAYSIIPAGAGTALNFGGGFAQAEGTIQLNGTAGLDGPRLRLTDGQPGGDGSAFYAAPVNIQAFTTYFSFQLSHPAADGITFAIQSVGAEALGGGGGDLGYAPIPKSVAIKFDLYSNAGEGPNSTGLFVNGARPTAPAIDLSGTGIDLHGGDEILARIAYDGAQLHLTLTDTATTATWSRSFAINIPATVGGDTAYVGFTGATGGQLADQQILSWTYAAGAPSAPPPALAAAPAPSYPTGFATAGMTVNGKASLSGATLQLTSGGIPGQAGSAFYSAPVKIEAFTTNFLFQLTSPNGAIPLADLADGITFVIQSAGTGAVGGGGGELGYAGIGESVAIKFDLYDNSGEGPNSTGLYLDGAPPTIPSVDLTGTGIDLHSGDPFAAEIRYDGSILALTLTDEFTSATWSHSFPIDIPATVGGATAFVGFTGGDGGKVANQNILNWTFSNP